MGTFFGHTFWQIEFISGFDEFFSFRSVSIGARDVNVNLWCDKIVFLVAFDLVNGTLANKRN
jgi:hypothetical protein